jgi:hypothetical protein
LPTKRRPLKHEARIGELVVTPRILDVYRAHQDEIRQHGRWTIRAGKLRSELHIVLNQMPWEDIYEHDLQEQQLHQLAYPDPKTRPRRLGGIR